MTRYTKLDGRRSLAKKMVDSDSEPESSTPVASPIKDDVTPIVAEATESSEPVASTSAAAAQPDSEDNTANQAPAPAANAEPPSIEKLLKRAKLLKLKAKKAKNEESKKRFQRMTRDVERQVEQMFGSFEYGPRGQLIRLGAPQSDNMWQSRHKADDWSAASNNASAMGGDGGWGARGGNKYADDTRNNSYSKGDSYANNGDNSAGWGKNDEERRMDRRDARREERAEQRQAKLKCFACRGMGHSAKECPNALDAQSISLKSDSAANTNGDTPMIGRDAVGICFRCGSTEHTLSKCRKSALKGHDELPFATCFICHSKGHLSSKCPNNAGRGVYPEGGSCKLCSSVEHLAKDCPLALRNESKSNKGDRDASKLVNQVIVGSTREGQAKGGDEDDFHSFARKRAMVDQEVKAEKSAKRSKSSSAKVVSF
uniref:E3 ubiquitin ligase interacting with arginine methyltransferase n=1 Tax=Melanopsichium pennsylvanicum 4 TaxID=1398559 RepID=A0A077R9V9_9BASI|nr:e3 ubiquitin ligase interacting with arginine methyltransferase [Melanopsichium pennsylvanicum 4]